MSDVKTWNVSAGSNNSSPPDGFPEGQAPSTLNNASREVMAANARLYADTNGTLDTTGSADTYLLAPNNTFTAYARGDVFRVEINATNTGASTLNVSSLGAKNIVLPNGNALAGGELVAGGVYDLAYDGTSFQLLGDSDEIRPSTDVTGLSAMTAAPVGTDDILYIDGTTIKTMSYNESAKPVNTDSGTHTFADTDVGTIRVYTGTTATDAWTMNTGVGQDGCAIVVINDSASTDGPTLTAGTATIETSAGGLIVKQNGVVVLVNIGSDVWKASGDLKA